MGKIKIKFEGVDSWGRPVFKDVKSQSRFGSVDVLFDHSATEKEVLEKISNLDLCYFGNSFGCEPMGTTPDNLLIIPNYTIDQKNERKIVSVIYSLELNEEIIREIINVDMMTDKTPLPIKLKRLPKVTDVKYPLHGSTKIRITIAVTNPKDIRLDPVLWNKIACKIEDHIN